jgi:simple sugar transport system permease protein
MPVEAPTIQYVQKSGWFDFVYKWGTLITIGVLVLVFGLANPSFLSMSNIINILRSIAIVTVIAIGVSVSLASGGIDLSVGSVASLADAIVISMFVWHGLGTGVSIATAVLVCMVVGLFNAFLVVKMRLPDLLATLASMFIFRGVAMTYTRGGSITENMLMNDGTVAPGTVPEIFSNLGQVPAIIIVMLIVAVVIQLFFTLTRHGRALYVVGGNLEAARLSGIRTGLYRTMAYVMSAGLAALGGVLLAARVGSSQVNAGSAYLMDAVAAAFIGFSLAGAGKANAFGALAGAVLIGVLQNGLVMMSVPYYAMDIIKGAVLVLALAITYVQKR